MILTLVVPSLLWPRQVMRDTLFGLDLPALQTLLGKGRKFLSPTAPKTMEAWWQSYFHAGPDTFSAAPLRLAALGENPGDARWVCADPVHLRVGQQGATLADPALLNLNAAEARQLRELLAPVFAEQGELNVTTTSHWHLRLVATPPALPPYLNNLIEHSATALLPAGDAGRSWRQLINEAQMALHAAPLNAERSAAGKAVVNSIALWGEGCAPVLRSPHSALLSSDDLIVVGAARLAGMKVQPLPPRFNADNAQDHIVNWDTLHFPAARHDALAWRDALERLEQDWLAPALQALADGELKRIELHVFGENETENEAMSFVMRRADRYRFWRKPCRLETV